MNKVRETRPECTSEQDCQQLAQNGLSLNTAYPDVLPDALAATAAVATAAAI